MATSDNYPNSYDLMMIELIEKILVSYFCDAKWAYDFHGAILGKKKEMLRNIALEIDKELNINKIIN